MNDKFESQKEKLISIKHEISLLYQQVNYLLRNEKPLELLDLDVLMNRTHTLYDLLCSVNLGEEVNDEDLPFDAEDLTGLFGGMVQEEPASETTEDEPTPTEEATVIRQEVEQETANEEIEPVEEQLFMEKEEEPMAETVPMELEEKAAPEETIAFEEETVEEPVLEEEIVPEEEQVAPKEELAFEFEPEAEAEVPMESEFKVEPMEETPYEEEQVAENVEENEDGKNEPLVDEFGFFFHFEEATQQEEVAEEAPQQGQNESTKVVHVLEAIPEDEIPERDRVHGDELVKDNPLEMPKMEGEPFDYERAEYERPASDELPGFFNQDEAEFEFATTETLGDKMRHEDNSLAAKLQQNSVRDLKSVIGINDKFLFVNELFGGSMEKYNKSIENLNDLKTLNGAMIYLNELKIELQWNSSNEAYQRLKDLVSRKFE